MHFWMTVHNQCPPLPQILLLTVPPFDAGATFAAGTTHSTGTKITVETKLGMDALMIHLSLQPLFYARITS